MLSLKYLDNYLPWIFCHIDEFEAWGWGQLNLPDDIVFEMLENYLPWMFCHVDEFEAMMGLGPTSSNTWTNSRIP
jgi:hypothetical protein